jgi:hypothetical protein
LLFIGFSPNGEDKILFGKGFEGFLGNNVFPGFEDGSRKML